MKLSGLRTALYIRRSTEEHQEASLEVQRGEGGAYILREGGSLAPEHVFVDDAKSRAEFKKRPGLIAMLNAAESKAFDAVVVRDDSRLGGDTNRTSLLIQDLTESGVRLFYYFSDEEVTLDGAVDRFMLNVRSFAAELEREKISQRTHEHLLTKARRGLVVGGRVYGYDNVEVREGDRRVRVEYKINAEQAAIILEIFRRYAAGEGLRTLAKDLNARHVPPPRAGRRGTGSWSPAAIWAMLRRDRYRGVLVWGKSEKAYRKGTKVRLERDANEWVTVDAPDLRIIDDATWAAVQAQIRPVGPDDARPRSAGGPRPRHLLSGLARCAECGGPLTVTNGRDSYTTIKVYACSYRRARGETVCGNSARRPVETINKAVVSWVAEHALSEELLLDVLREIRRRLSERATSTSSDVPRLESEASGLRAEVDRLVTAIATTSQAPVPLVRALAERQERLDVLDARLRAAKAAPAAIELEVRRMEAEARKRIGDMREALARNPEEARRVLQAVLDGPLRVSPVDVPEGRRFQIEGASALGRLLVEEGARDGRPNSASPAGRARKGTHWKRGISAVRTALAHGVGASRRRRGPAAPDRRGAAHRRPAGEHVRWRSSSPPWGGRHELRGRDELRAGPRAAASCERVDGALIALEFAPETSPRPHWSVSKPGRRAARQGCERPSRSAERTPAGGVDGDQFARIWDELGTLFSEPRGMMLRDATIAYVKEHGLSIG